MTDYSSEIDEIVSDVRYNQITSREAKAKLEALITKQVVKELEKMKSDAKKFGTYTENTAGGFCDEVDDRINQLKGTR